MTNVSLETEKFLLSTYFGISEDTRSELAEWERGILLDAIPVHGKPAKAKRPARPFKPEARLRLRPGNIEHATIAPDLNFIDANGHATPYMRGGYYA